MPMLGSQGILSYRQGALRRRLPLGVDLLRGGRANWPATFKHPFWALASDLRMLALRPHWASRCGARETPDRPVLRAAVRADGALRDLRERTGRLLGREEATAKGPGRAPGDALALQTF